MENQTIEKETFWTRPYPDSVLNLFSPLWKNRERKSRSERGIRRLLLVLAAVAVVFILLVNGFSDPAGYLVDIPSFSLGDMMEAYPKYYGYYFIALMAATSLLMALVNAVVRSKDEISSWSVNGVLLWVVSVAVGILADAIAREILLEKWILPVLEHKNDSFEAAWQLVYMLIAVVVSWYFVMDDFVGNGLSIVLTPYAMQAVSAFLPEKGILSNTLVLYLILTVVLKLLLNLLSMIGIDKVITKFFKKWFYTPKYMWRTYLYFFLFPILPFILIWKLIRRKN